MGKTKRRKRHGFNSESGQAAANARWQGPPNTAYGQRRGRPRKYHTKKQQRAARAGWTKNWRLKNPERWKEIQRRADAKRRNKGVYVELNIPPELA